MDDLISRQAVIDAIDEIESEVVDGCGYQYEKWRQFFCDLPAAGCMWIPVSERLPENDDHVLCTTVKKEGTAQVVRGYYDPAYRRWVSGMNSNVIAWMSMPEPWKCEEPDEDFMNPPEGEE